MKEHTSRKSQSSLPPTTDQTPAPFQPRPFGPTPEVQTPEVQPPDSAGPMPGPSFRTFSIQDPSGTSGQPMQPKLTIGAPNDPYEQEADRVAAQVVQRLYARPEPPPPQLSLQRQSNPEEADRQLEPVHQRPVPIDNPLQLKSIPPRQSAPPSEPLYLQPLSFKPAHDETASADLESTINRTRGQGQPMDLSLQTRMGSAMGADFSGVTIHADTQADQLNRSIQAKAFTTGQDIFFRQGAYQPSSRSGQELIAHELTHVVQQNPVQRLQRTIQPIADVVPPLGLNQYLQNQQPYLQAKLMTAAELEAITGVKRRKAVTRGLKSLGGLLGIGKGGSSYDDILGLLSDYEELIKSDVNGKQIAKRLAILTDLEKQIFEWYNSTNRTRDTQGEVQGTNSGTKKKIEILQNLLYEVLGERDQIAAMSNDIESGIAKTKGITASSVLSENVGPAESEAQTIQAVQKGFWSKVGDSISKTWYRTFGTEFYPDNVVPMHLDFLSEYDIRRSVELLELAMGVEKNLLSEGVEPLKATALAYQYLPLQLRPRSSEPEEKIVLKVKLQIFKESLKQKVEENKSTLEKAKSGVEGLDLANTVQGGAVSGIQGVEKGISTVTKWKPTLISQETVDSHSGVSGLIGSIIEVITSFVNIFDYLDKSTNPKTSKTEQGKLEEKAGVGAIEILEKLTAMGDQINSLSMGSEANPILGILSSVFSIAQNLIKGVKLLIRYYREGKLNELQEAATSGILSVLQRTAKRSRALAISAGFEIIISALDIAKAILGPTGYAGAVVTAVASVLKYGKKAVEQLEASYTAGLSQEAQLEAESGLEGSAKKVLKSSDKWGLTAIILEAKNENIIAVEKLRLYGIEIDDIRTMEVEDIRKIIMEELEREENAKTLTQKLTGSKVKG